MPAFCPVVLCPVTCKISRTASVSPKSGHTPNPIHMAPWGWGLPGLLAREVWRAKSLELHSCRGDIHQTDLGIGGSPCQNHVCHTSPLQSSCVCPTNTGVGNSRRPWHGPAPYLDFLLSVRDLFSPPPPPPPLSFLPRHCEEASGRQQK